MRNFREKHSTGENSWKRDAVNSLRAKHKWIQAVLLAICSTLIMTEALPHNYPVPVQEYKHKKVEKTAFVSITANDEIIGGMPFNSVTQYVNAMGLIQVSEEISDRTLKSLKTGKTEETNLFLSLKKDIESYRPQEKRENSQIADVPIALGEYYEPNVNLTYWDALGGYIYKSYPQNNLDNTKENRIEFLAGIKKLIENATLTMAKEGIYARAVFLPHYIEDYPEGMDRRKLINVSLQPDDIMSNPDLRQIFENESTYIRIGPIRDSVVLGQKIVLIPKRPVWVEINGDVFMLTAYKYDKAGK